MQHVNIYTASGIRSPRAGSGTAGYILEVMTQNGPATLTKTAEILNATANRSELRVLNRALERLTVPCELTIYTESRYVAAGIEELSRWQENGWKTSRGTDVANKEEWMETAELLKGHAFSVTTENHEYRAWLRSEVTRKVK